MVLRKQWVVPRTYWLGLGLAFLSGYGLYSLWFNAVADLVPGFADQIHGRHIVQRFLSPMEGHGPGSLPGYLALLPVYIPIVLVGFAPWTFLLPAGVAASIRHRLGDRTARVVLWTWAVPILLLFSLAATKLPHYVLPVFPPAAVLAAGAYDAWCNGRLSPGERGWLRGGAWFLAPVLLVSGGALCVAVGLTGTGPWLIAGMVPGVAILAWGGFLFRLILKEQVVRAVWVAFLGAPLIALSAALLSLPAIDPLIKISPALAATVRSQRSPDDPVAMCGYREPSFMFYLNLPADQSVEVLPDDPAALGAWLKERKAGWLIVYHSLWRDMIDRFRPVGGFRTLRTFPVLNLNDRARRDSVLVVRRWAHSDEISGRETIP